MACLNLECPKGPCVKGWIHSFVLLGDGKISEQWTCWEIFQTLRVRPSNGTVGPWYPDVGCPSVYALPLLLNE